MTRTVLSHTRPMTPSHQRQGWGVARSLRMSCRLADCPAANTLSRSVGEVAGLCAAVAVVSFGAASPANAAKLSLQLSGVSYQEVQCETRTGFTCVRFSGEVNNTDKKSINTADIYGRVYDNANNDVTDNEENDRIGYVDEIKPGKSTVSFNLSVPKAQLELGPLNWKGLKVSGFTGMVLPGQSGLLGLPEDLDCSDVGPGSDILDVEACEEQAAELAVR